MQRKRSRLMALVWFLLFFSTSIWAGVSVSTFAGSGSAGSSNGIGTAASFNAPYGITIDANGNLFVADTGSQKIRKITSTGVVSTIAGSGSVGSSDGNGTTASFHNPFGITVDASGNLFVADTISQKIRKITSTGVVSTFAGSGSAGSSDGNGTTASFYNPSGITIDANGNLFVADTGSQKIRKITSTGVVSTIAGSGSVGSSDGNGATASFNYPAGITIDASGNLFVADTYSNKIRKITSTGIVSTIAGSGSVGSSDGNGTAASFYNPSGVIIDANGNLFVADTISQKIRKITSTGIVSTIAGSGSGGSSDGNGAAASFSNPSGITIDANGNLFVTDSSSGKIRKIVITPNTTPSIVTLLASKTSVIVGESINFTATANDSDGQISSYFWDFGDGTIGTAQNTSHTYSAVGTYTVSLKVTDNEGSTATQTQTITIVKADAYYVLSAKTSGYYGSVSSDPYTTSSGTSFKEGSTVTLTATPYSSDYKFTGWSGDATGVDNPLTVTVDRAKSITANFIQKSSYTLSLTASTNGSFFGSYSIGSIYGTSSTGGSVYNGSSLKENTTVTLTATPSSSIYEFTGWSGDASGTTNPLTVTMDKAKSITAIFGKASIYTLTVTQPSNGAIKATPQKDKYADGDVVTLEAVGNSGYIFSSWSGDMYTSSEKTTITMNGNKTVSAKFAYDNTAPTISILSPVSNPTVTGKAYKIIVDTKRAGSAPTIYIDGIKKGAMSIYGDSYMYELNTCNLSAGSHAIRITAASANGILGEAQTSFKVEGCANADAPSVNILDPVANDTLTSVSTIRTDIQNIDQIKKAVLFVDGKPYGTVLNIAPYNFKLQTSALKNGSHTIKIKVTTLTGKLYESNEVTVKTENDIWQENVAAAIISPKGNDARSQKFTVTVGSSSGEKITGLSIFVDDREDALASSTTAGAEVGVSVDMSTYSDGSHTLKAYIETESGVVGYTPSVSFTLAKNCTDTACGVPTTPSSSVCVSSVMAKVVKSNQWHLLGASDDGCTRSALMTAGATAVWPYDTANGVYSTQDAIAKGKGFWLKSTKVTSAPPAAPNSSIDATATAACNSAIMASAPLSGAWYILTPTSDGCTVGGIKSLGATSVYPFDASVNNYITNGENIGRYIGFWLKK